MNTSRFIVSVVYLKLTVCLDMMKQTEIKKKEVLGGELNDEADDLSGNSPVI